jgi:hypothetical protein
MADILSDKKPCPERRKMTPRQWFGMVAGIMAMLVSGATILAAATSMAEQKVELRMTVEKNNDLQKAETDAIRREQTIQYANLLAQMGMMQNTINILQDDVKRILRRTE